MAETPTTVKESLARLEEQFKGFEKLIDERTTTTNRNLEELTRGIKAMSGDKADQKDLDALRTDFNAHKNNAVTKNEFRLVTTIVTVVMGTVIAALTIWEKLKG